MSGVNGVVELRINSNSIILYCTRCDREVDNTCTKCGSYIHFIKTHNKEDKDYGKEKEQ